MPPQNTQEPPKPFNASALAEAPRFPAWQFRSQAEFKSFLKSRQPDLDAQHLHQLSLAIRGEQMEQAGTCAICHSPTRFTSVLNGEILNDGRRLPNWREEMRCGCARRLTNRQRAVLHLARASGLLGWARSLLLGAAPDFALAYMAKAPETRLVPRFSFTAGRAVLREESSSCHFAISQDELQDIEPLDSALAELARVLVTGGRLVFTVPFHFDIEKSDYARGGGIRPGAHRFGWDLLAKLKSCGFNDASALLYWSEELGYLGNMNMIFLAVK